MHITVYCVVIMKHRFAFAGFRHIHIDDLYNFAKESPDIEITGAAEDDSTSADAARERGIDITDSSIEELMKRADQFDVVAVGDYYGRRGSLAIAALEAGKHVILDKPVCTSLNELNRIDELRKSKNLVVGCMLNNRDSAQFITLKSLVRDGAIGKIQTVSFGGQHPLLYGTRPGWYFEKGKHGGTINDIGIHAFDILPWLTGSSWRKVVAARTWNSRLPEHPHFQVCGQMMLEMEDDCGVLGDVSYLSPDSQGYTVPLYWRYTVHGTGGIIETGMKIDELRIWKDGADDVEIVKAGDGRKNGVFEDFLNEVSGNTGSCDLTSDQVIVSSRVSLTVQAAADEAKFPQKFS